MLDYGERCTGFHLGGWWYTYVIIGSLSLCVLHCKISLETLPVRQFDSCPAFRGRSALTGRVMLFRPMNATRPCDNPARTAELASTGRPPITISVSVRGHIAGHCMRRRTRASRQYCRCICSLCSCPSLDLQLVGV